MKRGFPANLPALHNIIYGQWYSTVYYQNGTPKICAIATVIKYVNSNSSIISLSILSARICACIDTTVELRQPIDDHFISISIDTKRF